MIHMTLGPLHTATLVALSPAADESKKGARSKDKTIPQC
jgi:hypothetical protein